MRNELSVLEMFPVAVFSQQAEGLNNEAMCQEIYAIHTRELVKNGQPHVTRSNIGGFHSGPIQDNPVFQPLKGFIVKTLNDKLLGGKWYLDKPIDESFVTSMWSMINRQGHSNVTHNHPLAWFSGVYYVKVPADNTRAGNLCFRDPVSARQYTNSYYRNVQNSMCCLPPVEGRLTFFPGWFEHSVKENETDEDRIAISFNIRSHNL